MSSPYVFGKPYQTMVIYYLINKQFVCLQLNVLLLLGFSIDIFIWFPKVIHLSTNSDHWISRAHGW